MNFKGLLLSMAVTVVTLAVVTRVDALRKIAGI